MPLWVTARALETQKTGLEDIVRTIRAGLESSEEVYREVIERVTVFEDYIDVRVKFMPGAFRVWYTASGKREAYTTTIRRWEVVQPCQPGVDGGPPAS